MQVNAGGYARDCRSARTVKLGEQRASRERRIVRTPAAGSLGMQPHHAVAAEAAHAARHSGVDHQRGQRARGGRAEGNILAAARGVPEDALEHVHSVVAGSPVACPHANSFQLDTS